MSELLKLCECCINMVCDVLFRFYSHCEGYEPTLMLIRTTDGEVPKPCVSLFLSVSVILFVLSTYLGAITNIFTFALTFIHLAQTLRRDSVRGLFKLFTFNFRFSQNNWKCLMN